MAPRDWLRIGLDPSLLFSAAGFDPDPWQAEMMRSESDRTLIMASRQVGKSLTTAMKAIHQAVFHEESLILLFAPSQRQSQELFRKLVDCYHKAGDPVPVARELATSIELENRSRVISLPGDSATVRGFSGVSLVIVDEAALVPNDDLFVATMPMLATSRGKFVALSTPFGKRGWFYDAWSSGSSEWTRITARATDCPRIDPAFLDEQRRTLGERWFSQEYMAVFVDTIGQVFSDQMIQAMFGEHDAAILEGF